MEISFTWHGDKLKKLIGENQQDALWSAAEKLLAEAQAKAPVRTGRLRDSGYISGTKRTTYVYRKGNKKERKAPNDGVIVVGFAAPHSHLVEFGTTKMRKQPFFRPALDSVSNELGVAVAATLGKKIKAAK